MTRLVSALAIIAAAFATPTYAQDASPGEGRIVVTIIPAGGSFFTEGKTLKGPSFGNFDLGGSLAVNFNRVVGVEAEVLGQLGVAQDLGDVPGRVRTPHMLAYNLNLVVSAPSRSVVPYLAGGIGGLTVFETITPVIARTESFLTGNIGGGVKWYAGRLGVRVDYRFLAVRSDDDASAFFARETRYGHRVYGALLINIGR